jgi:hypothetical protein
MILPRWTTDDWTAGAPSRILVEARWNQSHRAALVDAGHSIGEAGAFERGWGPVSIITRQGPTIGVADPRVATAWTATQQ